MANNRTVKAPGYEFKAFNCHDPDCPHKYLLFPTEEEVNAFISGKKELSSNQVAGFLLYHSAMGAWLETWGEGSTKIANILDLFIFELCKMLPPQAIYQSLDMAMHFIIQKMRGGD